MNYTRALFKVLGIQVLSLVLMVALVASFSSGFPSAHASSLGPELSQPETAVVPQQHEEEGESELPWLFAVFAITWAAFFGYVFVMSRRQQEMQREIEALKRAQTERERQALGTEPGPGSRES